MPMVSENPHYHASHHISQCMAKPAKIACANKEAGRGQGAGGPDPPLKNHKNIRFLSNTCPDHNHKATKAAFNVGPMMAHF